VTSDVASDIWRALLSGVADENKQSERERTMAVRYHKVKFFERVKLTRAMGRACVSIETPALHA